MRNQLAGNEGHHTATTPTMTSATTHGRERRMTESRLTRAAAPHSSTGTTK